MSPGSLLSLESWERQQQQQGRTRELGLVSSGILKIITHNIEPLYRNSSQRRKTREKSINEHHRKHAIEARESENKD